jgi:guanine deaminase
LNAIQNASIAAKALSFKKEHRHVDHDPVDSHFANRPFSIATLLYLATAGGAAVCGIQERVGSFGPGKNFDALLVNVGKDSSNPALWGMNVLATPRTADDIFDADVGLEEKQRIMKGWLESFLHGGDDRNIEKVYVQGRFVGGRKFRS